VGTNVSSSINWNYGVLPPGSYTLRVVSGGQTSTATFSVNDPPQVRVTDPDQTGGDDFATTVLGNAWDMSGPEDVTALANIDIGSVSFAGGVLSGTNTNSDPNIVLLDSASVGIDTTRYRFLTYRLKIDGPYDLLGGSVTRVFWSSTANADGSLMTTTKDILALPGTDPGVPGFVEYTIDLGALTTATNGGLELGGSPQPWGAAPVHYFRIDPHEFSVARTFHLDYVRLAAMREARGPFTLKYAASDANPGDAGATVKLYYAPDKNPATRQLIVSSLPLSASGQYVWDTSAVSAGTYYIYAEVSDGLDTRGSYSTGQLRVFSSVAPSVPANLGASAVSASAINLNWTASADSGGSGLAGYKVERCTGSGCTSFVQIATSVLASYADSGLSASTTYSYRVRAYDNAGNNSGYSNTATATTGAASASTTRLVNIATRGLVLTGDNVLIGGLIIGGSSPKTVLIRAVGPSMASLGVAGVLANPMLQLYSGQSVIASNDDWGSAANAAAIQATGLAPGNPLESAILITLAPGNYTAIVSGSGGGTGVGLVEVFEIDHPEIPLANLATRGQVQTGDNVMIGGFIIQGDTPKTVLIRAVGPSMASLGVPGVLANPMLQLYSGQTVIASNDDWQSATNAVTIQATGLAPLSPLESAILITLAPGNYTAIVSGSSGGTGVGLVEVFPQ
jgi:Fibronectin type III domain